GDPHRFLGAPDQVPVGASAVHLRARPRMEAYGHGAALLAGPGDVGSVSRLIVPTGAELDRDRQRSDSSRDVADRPRDEMRILQHGGAGAVAADLLHRAA